jgi:hypothetical protein
VTRDLQTAWASLPPADIILRTDLVVGQARQAVFENCLARVHATQQAFADWVTARTASNRSALEQAWKAFMTLTPFWQEWQ